MILQYSMMTFKAARRCRMSRRCNLHSTLILAQFAFAGFEILSRVALLKGAGQIVFSFYRNCIASLLLGLVGFIIEKKKRPALTFVTLCKFFFLGFIGVTINQVCYLVGLRYTSAIFASAMRNTIPVITFILAVLCGMEKLSLRRLHGQTKVVGCTLAICGSVLLSIYKGPAVLKSKLSIIPGQHIQSQDLISINTKRTIRIFWMISIKIESWQLGSIFIIVSCLAFAVFLILQTPTLKKYPAPISFAAFACFSSVLQLPVLAMIFEPQRSRWRPASVSEVTSIIYAGVIASGLVSGIQAWGVHEGGPVIVAAYQPLETVVTAILSFMLLKESLHLGSVIGGFLVISGLYLLIWGQEKERHELVSSSKVSDDPQLPFTVLPSNLIPFAAEVESTPSVTGLSEISVVATHVKIANDVLASELPESQRDQKASLESEQVTTS
ncbi:hypothetical protein O6H91_02G092800 [Diphasiastrum complanatum]|uniref:Uncharacterized protein n=1 Tax=Diphasiastrum complanatum TaxID=34168 RepID=A0ACC2EI16_DIPCM|nr:hypothetical protein O6H91_02G092800 [Diphasiastrum complanatum]